MFDGVTIRGVGSATTIFFAAHDGALKSAATTKFIYRVSILDLELEMIIVTDVQRHSAEEFGRVPQGYSPASVRERN